MTNPYTPPALPPDDLSEFPVLRGVHPPGLRSAVRLGGLAAAVSTVCITVFFNISHDVYGDDMTKMPFLVHQLRGASFYIAGVVLAVGFGRNSVWPAGLLSRLALLSVGGYACLYGAELLTLALHGVLLSQSEGIFVNIGLRSTFLIVFLCLWLKVKIRWLRLAAAVILGVPLWFFLMGMLAVIDLPPWMYWNYSAFNSAWSLLAAGQLWWMLRPAVDEPHLQRQDFLPERMDINSE